MMMKNENLFVIQIIFYGSVQRMKMEIFTQFLRFRFSFLSVQQTRDIKLKEDSKKCHAGHENNPVPPKKRQKM